MMQTLRFKFGQVLIHESIVIDGEHDYDPHKHTKIMEDLQQDSPLRNASFMKTGKDSHLSMVMAIWPCMAYERKKESLPS